MTSKNNQNQQKSAQQRNPRLTNNRVLKCDSGLHEYMMFKLSNENQVMACRHCGARKGGLPPISFVGSKPMNAISGKSHAKGSLTAKKN
jgi:hypothetical protein